MAEKYEVFISFKNTAPEGGLTVDRVIAKRLHAMLRAEGMNVFFSEKDLSETDFMEQIYMALDEAELLIVVCTDPKHVRSKWVKSEWTNFLGAINSDRKPDGKVMTVLSGMDTHGLPLELSNYQSFDAEKLENAVAYAFDVLGKVRNSEAQKRLDEENARLLKEAEEEKRQAIKGQTEAKLRTEQEKEKADKANKKAQSAERKAAEERKKRLAAEGKVKKSAKQRMIRWIITAAAVLLLAAVGVVAAVLGVFKPEWEYTKNKDGSVTAAIYNGLDSDVVVPEEIKGRKVTGISEYLFTRSNKTDITSITIPDSVTTIGDHAFYKCEKLTSVIMGDGVETIGEEAFNECYGLTSVTMGSGVKTIGKRAFRDCCALTSVTIPDGVKRIGINAFSHCTGLTSVSIPDSVTEIGESAFNGCTGITSITIGKGASSIGHASFRTSYTFMGMVDKGKNTSITVSPDNLSYSSVDGVLMNKAQTELITCPSGKTGQYKIPDSVEKIGSGAFSHCLYLTSVTMPDGILSVGDSAFSNCSGLTSVNIPDSVTSIGDKVFYGCGSLSSVTIGSGLEKIGKQAFLCYSDFKMLLNTDHSNTSQESNRLTEITVSPDNNYFCSEDGVLFNKSKTSLIVFPCGKSGDCTVPESVTDIGEYAFSLCYSLNSVTLPKSVTSISKHAFSFRKGLTVYAPNPASFYGMDDNKLNWVVQ